jgi:2-polyprenyl-6-methoxyphenol hydroxylase-like FAD-dependent oxidoreductase
MDWAFGHGEANLIMRPDGEVLFVISMPDGWFRAISNVANVLDLLPDDANVTEISWQTNFTVSLRQVASYSKDRAFLAGDAAHIHSPAGGRGMNLGIEDSTVLAHRIMEGGLEAYSRDRHRIGAQVVRDSDRQFRMASVRNPLLRPLRNALVRHVLGSQFVQRKFLRRMAGLDHVI